MRLLFCSNEQLLPLLGGGSAGNLKIMEQFVARGHDVTVCTPLFIDPKPVEEQYGITMKPFSPFYMHRTAPMRVLRYGTYLTLYGLNLQRVIAEGDYDLIFLRNCILAPPVYAARGFFKIPVAVSMTDVMCGFLYEGRMPGFIVDRMVALEKRLALGADRLFVITEEIRDYICADSGDDAREKVFVTLDGVDTRNFLPSRFTSEDRQQVRDELGIDGPLVMYHGIIDPYHGIRVMKEIIAGALETTDLSFLIVAKGEGYDQLKRELSGERVRCLDFIPYEEIPRYIHAADGGMIPYLANFNLDMVITLKLLEYLAMGKNTVSFALKAIEGIFGDKPYMGIAADTDHFVRLLKEATEKPPAEEASALIHRDFSWDAVSTKICERTEELYEASRRRPR